MEWWTLIETAALAAGLSAALAYLLTLLPAYFQLSARAAILGLVLSIASSYGLHFLDFRISLQLLVASILTYLGWIARPLRRSLARP